MDIVRHSVAADHSCLFTSVAYLCQGLTNEVELKTAGRKLREVCAEAVLADPDPATRALMLGHDSVEAYVQWIRNETHWGGEPEVLMLAEHFETRLVVVSCESLSTLPYGDGTNGTAYLLYTGQHYDPLPNAAAADGAPHRCFAPAGGGDGDEAAARDKAAIGLAQQHNIEAARRAKERRVQRLKCSGCGALCDDAAAFQAHCGEVEHDDDFTYDCEQVEVVVGADDALPESHVDLNAPDVHAFYNAADAETLSFSMRYAGAPFSVGGAQPCGTLGLHGHASALSPYHVLSGRGAEYPNLEAYWRSEAVEQAGLDERGALLGAALRAQYGSERGAALREALAATEQQRIVCVDVDPWMGMQAAGGISTGQNMLGKALMALRDEARA